MSVGPTPFPAEGTGAGPSSPSPSTAGSAAGGSPSSAGTGGMGNGAAGTGGLSVASGGTFSGTGGEIPLAGSGGLGGEPSNPGGGTVGDGAAGGSAGSGGAPDVAGAFWVGADISSIPEAIDNGATFVDTDGQTKSMLDLLTNHGFNAIRLRTFVEPLADYGYASSADCPGKAEAYNDRDHIVDFARQVKAKGMAFLLDFHYSDTWADPAKQVIPESWRNITTLDGMANQVHDYTIDVLTALEQVGASPDMVQVGNEITPGMLIHVPTSNTDCYGNNSMVRSGVTGGTGNWDNLATLLRAGIEGVHEVDPSIEIMLHIENTDDPSGVEWWVNNAIDRGVEFDVLGLSAYEAFQGPSSEWRATLTRLANSFPELSFSIVEYNPQVRLVNDILFELPDGRGRGTFFWEPTQSGSWGASIFSWQGNTATAIASDFAIYDQIRDDYGL